jgi:hypothetical protein
VRDGNVQYKGRWTGMVEIYPVTVRSDISADSHYHSMVNSKSPSLKSGLDGELDL